VRISILIPVFNEAESLPRLYEELCKVLHPMEDDWEILFVDDGSTDGGREIMHGFAEAEPRCRLIAFAKNFGQTAAILAGIDHAEGDVLIPMDADLQNDPADIPRLLEKLNEGYDVVSGWRRDRKDRWLSRRLPSIVANRLIAWTTGVGLHDYGCTLKAYRAPSLSGLQLYGEMHRFIPVYASWRGSRISEIEVNHRPRRFGSSSYGLDRMFKVALDLLTVKFMGTYSTKPAYVFGGAGAGLILLGLASSGIAIAEKLLFDVR
jgi:glycosyltransferase involved in cell wall biosynthesis